MGHGQQCQDRATPRTRHVDRFAVDAQLQRSENGDLDGHVQPPGGWLQPRARVVHAARHTFEAQAASWAISDRVADAFRTGEGIAWSDNDPRLFSGVRR